MKLLITLLLVMGLLTACSGESFHLRGEKPLPLIAQQGVYLQGVDLRSDFGMALLDGLEDAGAVVKKQSAEAGLTLELVSLRENRSVTGYSSTRQVREFNHWIDVDFKVSSQRLPQSLACSVHAERSQVYDGKYVLGTAEEENLIKDELRREAVRLMLLRLQALSSEK